MSEWDEYDAIHNAKDEKDAKRRLREWEKASKSGK